MSKVQIINGNETAAMGAKLCRVQVIAAYPITPQSKIPETLIKYVESGELEAEFIETLWVAPCSVNCMYMQARITRMKPSNRLSLSCSSRQYG